MKVSGFTFGRNLVRAGYPIEECIRSILPIVDEFVVNIGHGEDDSVEVVKAIGDPKIKIVESEWNPNLTTGGFVLAQQTNIALFNCTGVWAIYLQADELIHEKDHAALTELMRKHAENDRVEGIALERMTFYGDSKTVLDVYPTYREPTVRVVKPHRFVLSRGDAFGFSVHPKYKQRGRHVRVVDSGMTLYHYGPSGEATFENKKQALMKLHDDIDFSTWLADNYQRVPRQFVKRYEGDHPAVMADRIRAEKTMMDLDSPNWRTEMTLRERRNWLKTKLIKHVSSRFNRRGDHVLVKP